MKTQDLPLARQYLAVALAAVTADEKDRAIRKALEWMRKTVTKVPVFKNTMTAGFRKGVIEILNSPGGEDLQDVEIARRCGATASAAARVSEIRNGVR